MGRCERCGSYAINPLNHGRIMAVDLHLCDVCYWRKRAEELQADLRRTRNALEEAVATAAQALHERDFYQRVSHKRGQDLYPEWAAWEAAPPQEQEY